MESNCVPYAGRGPASFQKASTSFFKAFFLREQRSAETPLLGIHGYCLKLMVRLCLYFLLGPSFNHPCKHDTAASLPALNVVHHSMTGHHWKSRQQHGSFCCVSSAEKGPHRVCGLALPGSSDLVCGIHYLGMHFSFPSKKEHFPVEICLPRNETFWSVSPSSTLFFLSTSR